MKKSKIIIPALAMLVMSTAATVTGTVAWFSMNTTVTATGMKVKASGEGSLFITEAGALPTNRTRTTSVEFSAAATDLYPSTHGFSDGGSVSSSTGLIRLTNGIDVNPETGTLLNGDTAEYAAVAAADAGYFVDYDVYLSAGAELSGKDIIINLITPSTTPATVNQAVSVDFYGGPIDAANAKATVSSGTYFGTLNLAGMKNNAGATGSAAYTKFEIEGPSNAGVTIPQANNTAAYAIKMRVFYDGALIEQGNSNNKVGTELETLESGTSTSYNTAGQYIYDAQGRVVDLPDDTPVAGYKVVDPDNSVYTYARTSELASTAQVTFGVTFSLKDHDAGQVNV